MAALYARLARVTGRAKALKIVEIEREFGVSPDWLDVIDFEPAAGAAFYATKAVSTKYVETQVFPFRLS